MISIRDTAIVMYIAAVLRGSDNSRKLLETYPAQKMLFTTMFTSR